MSSNILSDKKPVSPVAVSRAMQAVMSLLDIVARTLQPIFFYGARGSGKTFCARYVHAISSNSEHQFLQFPGERLTPQLLDTFKSSCGTLYISEAACLSSECQEKLLTMLQTPTVTRRIVLASETLLDYEISSGSFSADLYSYFMSLPIYFSPLRERIEDIKPLALAFLERFSFLYNKRFSDFSIDALKALENAYWANNITELQFCIETACKNGMPPVIQNSDLRLNNYRVSGILSESDRGLKTAVDRFKKEYILQILIETKWNQTEAAKILGVQRTYLSRLMKELNIR